MDMFCWVSTTIVFQSIQRTMGLAHLYLDALIVQKYRRFAIGEIIYF